MHLLFSKLPKASEVSSGQTEAAVTLPSGQGRVSRPQTKERICKMMLGHRDRLSFWPDQVGLGVQSATEVMLEFKDTPGDDFPHSGPCPLGVCNHVGCEWASGCALGSGSFESQCRSPAPQVSRPACLCCRRAASRLETAWPECRKGLHC